MTESEPQRSTQAGSEPAPDSAAPTAIAAAFRKLDSAPTGLSAAAAAARLARDGRNAIETHTDSRWRKLASYFWGPLPWMIEAAALISAVRQDWPDFGVVTGLLVYNAAVGFWQDNKAANALAALQKGLAPKARVLRDGQWRSIDAAELVLGDVVSVAAGQILPADLLLVDGEYLSVDQAALTGESMPVTKKAGDSAYSGSIAKQGEMVGLVTADRRQHLLRPHGAPRRARRHAVALAEGGDADRRLLDPDRQRARGRPGRGRGPSPHRAARQLGLGHRGLDRAVRPGAADRLDPGGAPCRHERDHGHRRLCAVAPAGDPVAPLRHRGAGRRRRLVQRQDRHPDHEPVDGRGADPLRRQPSPTTSCSRPRSPAARAARTRSISRCCVLSRHRPCSTASGRPHSCRSIP